MVIKAVLDTLLLFVSFNESGTEGGGGGRTGSPDSSGGANTAQLLFEAVETHSEKKGSKKSYSFFKKKLVTILIQLGLESWSLFLSLINEKSTQDAEIQTKTMTLINRVSQSVSLSVS